MDWLSSADELPSADDRAVIFYIAERVFDTSATVSERDGQGSRSVQQESLLSSRQQTLRLLRIRLPH